MTYPCKTSIVIPTYDRSDVLPSANDSICAQTTKGFEVIIVDDGSTDNIKETVLVRRSVFEDMGLMDESLRNSLKEWKLGLWLAKKYKVRGIDKPLVRQKIHEESSVKYLEFRINNHRWHLLLCMGFGAKRIFHGDTIILSVVSIGRLCGGLSAPLGRETG